MTDRYEALIKPLLELEGMEEALAQLRLGQSIEVMHLVDACKGHLVYGISQFLQSPAVIITYDELRSEHLKSDLEALAGKDSVLVYPARDMLFYNADVRSMELMSQRLKVIDALINQKAIFIIIPVEALLNPLSPRETFMSLIQLIKIGDHIDLLQLEKKLIQMGYERTTRVEAMGQFAIRGGILDIFSAGEEEAYRIEFWDNEVDSIRSFNIKTQRSIKKIEAMRIIPNQEIIIPIEVLKKAVPAILADLKHVTSQLSKESAMRLKETVEERIEQINQNLVPKSIETLAPYTNLEFVSILEYLSKNHIVFLDEPIKTKEKSNRTLELYHSSMKERLNYGHILPKEANLIFEYEAILYRLKRFRNVLLMNFTHSDESHIEVQYKLPITVFENNNFYKNLDLLEKDLRTWKEEKKRIVLLTGSKTKAMRLSEELEARGIIVNYVEDTNREILKGQIVICKGHLNKGFTYPTIDFCMIADKDLFGKEKQKKKPQKKYQGAKIQSFLDLTTGDYVVHEQYGIGIFCGIEQIVVEGMSKDNLKIEYANNHYLYVPINQMDQVQKYVGAATPKLHKIGGVEWKKSKAKARKAIKDIAADLLQLYSARQTMRGFCYDPDNIWQKEFEELFPYKETDDQLTAISDVKQDMESYKIMDRLICGDVGYGKTEVAIRAAFKAVQSNKQVAYLVPTTILAQQHYERFAERMENYPIQVNLLSRFRTPKQIKETLKGLEKGYIDIVIGTHRLLSNDVKFKDLGLVIIDEEQRFGVTHKEKLKQLRKQVDVMSLTATPIPRTLHMSLIGLRDMSLLEEAPMERKAIQTYVIEYSQDFVKDAIIRELTRGGQIYFLHNQVQDIDEIAEQIQLLVPEARVHFAHGQMSERELERIMLAFIQGEIDVLVCTTIIETGLDIPNANTIIINGADRMGLSQLYQLRGRVGRADRLGYAYLMYQKDKALKEVAEKRLQAIKQFTSLGSGFKIAMRDLEIRGAGNLLGAQQHGHMEAIGYDLYCKMLAEVVTTPEGTKIEDDFETTIEIKTNAFIPNDYITEEVEKLDIYKKIAMIENEKDYYDIGEEIEDRYGTVPEVVYNLLDIALIKAIAHALYMSLVKESPKQITFTFRENAPLCPESIPNILKAYKGQMKFINKKEASIVVLLEDKKNKLQHIKNILHDLDKLKTTIK